MKSGKLRYPSEILRDITEKTSTGAETVIQQSILKTRAGITYVSSRDYVEGGAETMETTVKVVIRKPKGKRVLMGDIIIADGKKFDIMGVLEFDNGRSLTLMCKELL